MLRSKPARFYFAISSLFVACTASAKGPAQNSGVLAEGTKWTTPYYVVDSGMDGPTVLITGGVHGNEPAGAEAAEQVRHWPIVKGTLIVVPRANRPGLAAQTRYLPGEGDDSRDLNRDFPRDGAANEARGVLAIAIWRLAQQRRPDWALDLHEGYAFHVSHEPPDDKKKSVGSTVIYFRGEALDGVVQRMLDAVNTDVTDPDRRFVAMGGGPVDGSLARA
jgi:Succinylglutamate desuccinylase / Aspartoacylase family